MLKAGDYVIIILVAVSFIAAVRHILGSWKSGTCPGCGGCGKPARKKRWWSRKKESGIEQDSGECRCCSGNSTEEKIEDEAGCSCGCCRNR